ncbi:hypothetical protein BsWGS_20731 [Bradybaena similaris]
MAAQGSQEVFPNQNTSLTTAQAGQNKPGTALHGSVQPGVNLQRISGNGSPTTQSGEPVTNAAQHQLGVNNFPSQMPQGTRMPLMPPRGYPAMPPTASQLAQTPSSLSTQRPPGRMPPPSSSIQYQSPFRNGPDGIKIRPSMPTGFPPAGGPIQKQMSLVGGQGTEFSHVQGMTSQNSAPPQVPTAAQLAPSSRSVQAASPLPFNAESRDTARSSVQNRPNELPVPFHGQGQYSHQVNPFLQKSPADTPTNSGPPSARTSRDPSPIFGLSMDALEGQFTPGHGAPSPTVSGARSSPIPSHVPGVMPVTTGTFTPPPQSNFPAQGSSQQAPTFSLASQQMASVPGYSPRPPLMTQQNQQFPGQQERLQQSLFQGQRPLQAAGDPSGQLTTLPSVSNIQPRIPSPSLHNIPGYAQPPISTLGALPPPPPSGMQGSFPPQSNTTVFSPPPPPLYMTGSEPLAPQYRLQAQPGMPNATYSHYPNPQAGPMPFGTPAYPSSAIMTQSFGQMNIHDSQRVLNLLNERTLMPPDGIETAKPTLPPQFKNIYCNPDVFRCTLNAVPQTSSLLSKSRLPLGILIHPFKDLSQLPVIQSSVIVRCRACRSYINPFVTFIEQRKWKCNLCFRTNDVPDEFSFDPVTKTYGDPQRRPEVRSATIEFIAPSEYMLRPPQPAVYLFLLDVSFNAVETGYLHRFCYVLMEELDRLPGDARTAIGFLCYDKSLYYFNLSDGLSRPQMMCVSELEDTFLPIPDSLLVNLHESKELVVELLKQLPKLFEGNQETGSALGAALQSALKLMSPTGGRVTVMQTCLPTIGPGALQNRDSGNTSGKNATNIGPATDFYKKLALDCSKHQIAVDLFMLNGQYADIATLSCISKYTAGCIYYYPSFHTLKKPGLVAKFSVDLHRYLTRKIGFESVMRIRCTRGLSIHTFHGNFFVRSTDLLSLPNINPDAGFGMQISIEDNLTESSTVSFQAALLYTSSKGERRIRVHTLCVPVTDQLSEIFTSVDQLAVVSLLAKMAVDRSLNSSLSDARESMTNATLDALSAYTQQIPATQRVGALVAPFPLRMMPMLMLSMLKNLAFSQAGSTKPDDRVFALLQCKVLPVGFLIQKLLPHLYPLHQLSNERPLTHGKEEIPGAPLLPLSSASVNRSGLYLLDTGEAMYLLVGNEVGNQMCQDVFGKPDFLSLLDGMENLPELDNPTSKNIRNFISYLRDTRPHGVTLLIIRDDSAHRFLFSQHLHEDRTETSMSYYEFLQFLQGKAKG